MSSSPQADDLPPDQFADYILAWVKKNCPSLRPEAQRFTSRLIEEGSPCRAGPGFTSVIWYGTEYQFTSMQSHIVRILWEAWERGTPAVRQEFLIEAVGAESESKMSWVFRDNPAWGVMIVPAKTRGTYMLGKTIS